MNAPFPICISTISVCKRVYCILFLNEMLKCDLYIINLYIYAHKKQVRDGTRIQLPCILLYKYTYSTVVNECQFKSPSHIYKTWCVPGVNTFAYPCPTFYLTVYFYKLHKNNLCHKQMSLCTVYEDTYQNIQSSWPQSQSQQVKPLSDSLTVRDSNLLF